MNKLSALLIFILLFVNILNITAKTDTTKFDFSLGYSYKVTPIDIKRTFYYIGPWIPGFYENEILTGSRLFYNLNFNIRKLTIRIEESFRYSMIYYDEMNTDSFRQPEIYYGKMVKRLTTDFSLYIIKPFHKKHFDILPSIGYSIMNIGSGYKIDRYDNGNIITEKGNFIYHGFNFGCSIRNSDIELGISFLYVYKQPNSFVFSQTFITPELKISYNFHSK